MENQGKQRIIIAVTGASGSLYAKLLFEKIKGLSSQVERCAVVFSDTARQVWAYEIGSLDMEDIPGRIYEADDFFSPIASGSSGYHTMIVCPCSMGTMGRIANGSAAELITRAADVMLKERRKLILVLREMPYSLIHINNMKLLTEAGAIICPASPSFYSRPLTLEAAVGTVVDKVLQMAGFSFPAYQWQAEPAED